MAYGVLVIEDEATLAKNIGTYLGRAGYEVRVAGDGGAGLEMFDTFKPDLVLLDLRLPDLDGIEILRRMRKVDATLKVVIMTAHGAVETAVEAMKAGAYDYVTKPVVLGDLKRLIERAIGEERIEETLSYYRRRDALDGGPDRLIGDSAPMQALKDKIGQLLEMEKRLKMERPPPVLITGETGTGKDLIARSIHFGGPRRERPFIEINCAALPPSLVEEELFGHERGAFTDAKERKLGLVEAANGGSLFLNEIGELDLGVQAKLLKLLEDHKIRRLGGIRERSVNLRILAATNRNLESLIREGVFRSDLYFRIKIASLEAPPLHQRGDDILLLANGFLIQFARQYGRAGLTLSEQAAHVLTRHSWPGNVRELKNMIEQAVMFASGETITPDGLSLTTLSMAAAGSGTVADSDVRLPAGGLDIGEVERGLLVQALDQTEWNITAAARLLGLSRDALRYRIDKFDLRQAR